MVITQLLPIHPWFSRGEQRMADFERREQMEKILEVNRL
jgi:hypothetical protein